MTKEDYIAYCGLDCEACEAHMATVHNDDALRRKVAKEWSELNGVEITPEMINCSGCRIPGEEYDQIAENMMQGIDFFFPGFEGTKEEGLRLIVDQQLSPWYQLLS